MSDQLEAVWLFVRGNESVRITRSTEPDGLSRIVVEGPGRTSKTHQCDTLADCMRLQQQIDADLMAQGFQVQHSSERRTGERRQKPRGRGRRR